MTYKERFLPSSALKRVSIIIIYTLIVILREFSLKLFTFILFIFLQSERREKYWFNYDVGFFTTNLFFKSVNYRSSTG